MTDDSPTQSMPTQSMDEIMASIRRIVSDAPLPLDAAFDESFDTPPAPAPAEPIPGGDTTIEAFLRSMLEPMLKTWLDANLPEIVEATTRAEIYRLTGRKD